MNDPIARIESNVRGYARLFPAIFDTAVGSTLTDHQGREYIDFFCGAGTLNYGHNHPDAKAALIEYIQRDGIQHSLDTVTSAKVEFIEQFEKLILKPRGLDYRLQFTGPTGTNAVEAAIKLARKRTRRNHVVAFTNAYHGHSLGALALTGNRYYHSEYYGSRNNVTHLPFDGYAEDVDSISLLTRMLEDSSSGLPVPAAVILETVQGEGGVNVASDKWLRSIAELCRTYEIALIVDDIQVGNGRTGRFFSFESAEIKPDLVCLSKSIGGGLPMSLVLIDPAMDVWQPGQHTGTFRGNNLAFVAASAVLQHWADPGFEEAIEFRSQIVQRRLAAITGQHAQGDFSVRGRGLIWGLDVRAGDIASKVIRAAFNDGLLIEAAGADDQVLKVMPALTIAPELLEEGLARLARAVANVLGDRFQGSSTTAQPPILTDLGLSNVSGCFGFDSSSTGLGNA